MLIIAFTFVSYVICISQWRWSNTSAEHAVHFSTARHLAQNCYYFTQGRPSKRVSLQPNANYFDFLCQVTVRWSLELPFRLTLSKFFPMTQFPGADFSFLRILRMKFFSPWLLIPLSYFRWRGRLPSCCPASRLGWFQLLSPLCNALLIDSKGDGLTELLNETKLRTGYPLLASAKEGKCWLWWQLFF